MIVLSSAGTVILPGSESSVKAGCSPRFVVAYLATMILVTKSLSCRKFLFRFVGGLVHRHDLERTQLAGPRADRPSEPAEKYGDHGIETDGLFIKIHTTFQLATDQPCASRRSWSGFALKTVFASSDSRTTRQPAM